jgi:hypothetical protein
MSMQTWQVQGPLVWYMLPRAFVTYPQLRNYRQTGRRLRRHKYSLKPILPKVLSFIGKDLEKDGVFPLRVEIVGSRRG